MTVYYERDRPSKVPADKAIEEIFEMRSKNEELFSDLPPISVLDKQSIFACVRYVNQSGIDYTNEELEKGYLTFIERYNLKHASDNNPYRYEGY